MYFTGNDGYQKSLVFTTVLSSLKSNLLVIEVTSRISTRILPEKIKQFDNKFELN